MCAVGGANCGSCEAWRSKSWRRKRRVMLRRTFGPTANAVLWYFYAEASLVPAKANLHTAVSESLITLPFALVAAMQVHLNNGPTQQKSTALNTVCFLTFRTRLTFACAFAVRHSAMLTLGLTVPSLERISMNPFCTASDLNVKLDKAPPSNSTAGYSS